MRVLRSVGLTHPLPRLSCALGPRKVAKTYRIATKTYRKVTKTYRIPNLQKSYKIYSTNSATRLGNKIARGSRTMKNLSKTMKKTQENISTPGKT